MLKLYLPENELYDERTNTFVTVPAKTIELEHSLISISKWEAKWQKPFLHSDYKEMKESIDYVKCMTITRNVTELDYLGLTRAMLVKVNNYIDNPMSATTITKRRSGSGGGKQEIVTSELIYYWMVTFGIPIECEKWHLNRLLTLIQICDIKGGPQHKMSQKETLAYYKSLNSARRQRSGSRG